jgi:hypothetical protein
VRIYPEFYMRYAVSWHPNLTRALPVPTDGTGDQAVEAVIREYRQRTGIELDEPAVRPEVRRLRAQTAGETP